MGSPVMIVESEEKAKTLHEQYGNGVESLVVPSAPVKAVSIPPADELKRETLHFRFEALPARREFIEKLLAAQGEEIYIALDSDQRGEYWAWLISEFFGSATQGKQLPKRLHLLGLNSEELRESLRLVKAIQKETAIAVYVRMLFDAHLGKHLQRLIGTVSGPENLPLGYHSLTTLSLLAEREEEIRMFTPAEKWQVNVTLATEAGSFEARLEEAYGITDDGVLRDAGEAARVVEMFKDEPFVVAEVERSPVEIHPPAPYRLSQLLNDAYAAYKFTPVQVFTAVQKLFYGVELQGKRTGLISAYLPAVEADMGFLADKIKAHIRTVYGEEAVRSDASDFAGGILPLHPGLKDEELQPLLNQEAIRIYGLIRDRAVASLMKNARGENVVVALNAGEECIFRASRRAISEKGFLEACEAFQYRELLNPCPLLALEAGLQVRCRQIAPGHGGGFPAEYYSFEGLVTDWEDFGLEMDGATVSMLQYLLDKNYLSLMPDGTLRCKENTLKLYSVMKRAFPTMAGIQLSAYFKQTLDEVASGRKTLPFALKQFDQTLMMRGEVLVKLSIPQQLKRRERTSSSIIKTQAPEPDREKEVTSLRPSADGEIPGAAGGETGPELQGPAAPFSGPEMEVLPPAGGGPEPSRPETGEEAGAEVLPEAFPPAAAEPEAAEADGLQASASEAAQEGEPLLEPADMEERLSAGRENLVETEEERREWERVFAEAAGLSEETVPKETEKILEGPGKECPDCGRPLLLKEDRFGRYWSCSGHPECRYSQSYGGETGPEMLCPLCAAGNVISKQTPTGKLFYVCPEKSCEFMAWSKPHDVSCQVCDSPFLVEKKAPGGKTLLRCPRAGCNYMQPLPGETITPDGLSSLQPQKRKVRVRRVARGSSGQAGGKTRKVRVVRRKA